MRADATIVDRLERWSVDRPDATAYVFLRRGAEVGRLTFSQLRNRASGVAGRLLERGLAGQPVALAFESNAEFLPAFLGCLLARAVAIPCCPPRSPRSKIQFRSILQDSGAKFVLTSSESSTSAEGAEILATGSTPESDAPTASPSPDDLAFLQYTSGSTGNPKGVMVSHRNLLENERVIEEAFEHGPDTVVVGWLPLFHDMGLIGNALQPLYLGRPCALLSPLEAVQKPLRWLEAISNYRATTSGAPGFAYAWCADRVTPEERARLDLSSWNLAYVGAEPVHGDVLDRFAETFASCGFRREALYPCYGLAESTLFVTGIKKGTARRWNGRVSLGYPRRGHRVEIVNGEVWVAGPSVAQGYWKRDEESFRGFLETGEGPFLRTGDLGSLHEGELYLTGRIKDIIILRGTKHHSEDLECTAERSHPALRSQRSAAFSVDGEENERLVVVQETDSPSEEIAQAIRAAVTARHEIVLDSLVFVPVGSLPRTSSGKIRRRECRALYLEGRLRQPAEVTP